MGKGMRKRLSAEVEEVGFDGPDSIAIYLDGEEISRTCIVDDPKAETSQLLATYQRVLETGAKAEREAVATLVEEAGVIATRGKLGPEWYGTIAEKIRHPRRGLSE